MRLHLQPCSHSLSLRSKPPLILLPATPLVYIRLYAQAKGSTSMSCSLADTLCSYLSEAILQRLLPWQRSWCALRRMNGADLCCKALGEVAAVAAPLKRQAGKEPGHDKLHHGRPLARHLLQHAQQRVLAVVQQHVPQVAQPLLIAPALLTPGLFLLDAPPARSDVSFDQASSTITSSAPITIHLMPSPTQKLQSTQQAITLLISMLLTRASQGHCDPGQ